MFSAFQNLFNTLSGRPDLSPRTWPPSTLTEPPAFDTRHSSLGPLRFGDPLEHAQVLGRPDRFEQTAPHYHELLYAHAGFQIDFDSGRFAYVAFFIAADNDLPASAPITFSQPVLDSHRLSPATSLRDIEALVGPPKSRATDADETLLFYEKNGLTLEFEFMSSGLLKRLNLFPSDATTRS